MKRRHIIILSIFIELLILAAVTASGLMLRRANTALVSVPALSAWSSAYIENDGGIWSVADGELTEADRYEDDLTTEEAYELGAEGEYPVTVTTALPDETRFSLTLAESPQLSLPRGSYTLVIVYSATVDQYVTLRLPYGADTDAVLANPAVLSRNRNVTEYHFKMRRDAPVVSIAIPYNYYGNFSIDAVSLLPNMDGTKSLLVVLIASFLLVDVILFDVTGDRRITAHIIPVFGVALIAGAASLPLFMRGAVIGQDEYFHLMRIEGIASALRSGQLPVRMQGVWMDGFGYPISVYYGDILLYLPALLRLAGFSVNAAYKLYIAAVNIATAASAYLCLREMFGRDYIALICSAGYTLAAYRLVDVYARSAVGESAAFIFFPIVTFAVWRMYRSRDDDSNGAGYRRVGAYAASVNTGRSPAERFTDAVLLAVGMSGLVYTHLLSVAMTAALLAVIALIFPRRTFTRGTLLTWVMGVFGTILLSAGFLVPFMDYTLSVSTNSAINEGEELIQWGGAFWYQYFMVFMKPFGSNSALLSERMSCSPGLMLMTALVAAVVHICLRHAKRSTIYAFIMSVLCLWLASDTFPWDFISEHINTAFAAIQFPWRFVGEACICLTVLLGCLMSTIEEHALRRDMAELTTGGISVILAAAAIASAAVFAVQYAANDYRGYFIDTAELDPYATSSFFLREGIADDEPLSLSYPASEGIEVFDILGRGDSSVTFRAEAAPTGGYLELPVFYYPYYHLADEDGEELPLIDGSHHLIGISLDGGYSGTLRLWYEEPLLWRISEVVSLAAAIGAVIACVRLRHGESVSSKSVGGQ